VKNVVVESDIRNGKNGLTSSINSKTISKILDGINATMEKGQRTTKARHRERKDIRNMVTMAVMNEAYSFNKPPQLIGNFDATQFILTGNSEELLVTIEKNHPDDIIDGDVENQPLSSVADTSSEVDDVG